MRLKSFLLDAYNHSIYHKKELGVFLRVPGNDQQKTDLVNTLGSPRGHRRFGPLNISRLRFVTFSPQVLPGTFEIFNVSKSR